MAATPGLTTDCSAEASAANNSGEGRSRPAAAIAVLPEAGQRFLAEVAALAEETARQASVHERCAARHACEARRCSELGEWHALEAQRLYRAAATCRRKAQTARAMSTGGASSVE